MSGNTLDWLTEPLPAWVEEDFALKIHQMRDVWARKNVLIGELWSAKHIEVETQIDMMIGVFIPAALRRIAQLEAEVEQLRAPPPTA